MGDILPKNAQWLDYGCGEAMKKLHLLELDPSINYYGCDFSTKVIKSNLQIRDKEHPQAHCYFSTQIPLDREFDLITSVHTFEHVSDPQELWHTLWARTKEFLIVQVPYKDSFPSPDHLWKFEETSFKTPTEPLVLLSPFLNTSYDREIVFIWSKKKPLAERVFLKPFGNTMSPHGWFMWQMKIGYVPYYYPLFRLLLEKILPLKSILKLKSFVKKYFQGRSR